MPKADNPASFEQLGRLRSATNKRLDVLEQAQASTGISSVTSPVIDNSFTPVFTPVKKGNRVRVLLRFASFGNADDIKIVMVYRDEILTSDDYDQRRFHAFLADKIDANAQVAQSITTQIDLNLFYGRVVDIIRLVAVSADGQTRATNPLNDADANYAGYPGNVIYSFTTPEAIGAPSAPSAGLITYNELDPVTPDIYDAHAGLKIYAPLTVAGAAQTWGAVFETSVPLVQAIVTRDYGGTTGVVKQPYPHTLTDVELTQVDPASTPANRGFVVIDANNLVPGGVYTWTKNTVTVAGQDNVATGSVSFVAALLASDLSLLTNVLVGFRSTDPFDSKHIQPYLEFTQTSPPTALKNYTFKYKKSTDTDFEVAVVRNNDFQADAYHKTLNAGTLSIPNGSKVVTGVGTEFLTRLQEGWKIKVGAQTLTIGTITSDTSMTVTANSSTTVTASAYTVVIVTPLMDSFKVKPSTTYNTQTIIRTRNGATRTVLANVTLDADGNVVNDTAAPVIDGTLGVPIFEYNRGKFFCKLKLSAITNWNNPIKVEICITDTVGSLNIDDLVSTSAVAANTFYDIGKTATKITVPIPREQLHQIFGTSGNLRCYFRLTNGFTPTPTVSPSSGLLDLATLKDVTTLYNPANILRNGHFTYHDGTTAKRWQDYDPRTGVFGSVDQTGRMRFDVDEHRARWRGTADEDNQRFLVQNLHKVFMKDEFYSLVWNFYSNGTLNINEIVISLWTFKTLTNTITTGTGSFQVSGTNLVTVDLVKVGTVIGNGTEWRTVTQILSDSTLVCDRAWGAGAGAGTSGFAMIPQADRLSQTNVALTTADLIQKGTIQTDSDLDTSLDVYFGVVFREVIGTVTVPFMDAICLNAGQESAGYQRSIDSFETNDAGTSEDFDSQPTGGSSSGNQQLPGTGLDPGDIYDIPYL